VVVGSFLPWARAGIFSVAGTSGDGVITLVLGAMILVGAFVGRDDRSRVVRVVVLGCFAAATWIASTTFTNVGGSVAGTSSVGSGLLLTLAVSAIGVLVSLVWVASGVAPDEPAGGKHTA